MRSFNRFADDHEKEWVKQLDEHMETRPPPLPVIQAEMKLEEKAKAFGFRKKPNFKVRCYMECFYEGVYCSPYKNASELDFYCFSPLKWLNFRTSEGICPLPENLKREKGEKVDKFILLNA